MKLSMEQLTERVYEVEDRFGDNCYSNDTLERMREEIDVLKQVAKILISYKFESKEEFQTLLNDVFDRRW